MPRLLPTIDEIADEKKRPVVLLSFPPAGTTYNKNLLRTQMIEWLRTSKISFEECGDDPSHSGRSRYQGELFVDVACEPPDAQFIKLRRFLFAPDGAPKFKWVSFAIHEPKTTSAKALVS